MLKGYPLTQEQFNCKRKLNLGCGDMILDGYENVDLYAEQADVKLDIRSISGHYGENAVDLILASHVIEHFHWEETLKILTDWHKVLKPNGWLILEFPDAEKCFRSFLINSDINHRFNLFPQIIGNSAKPGHEHKVLLWRNYMAWLLKKVGFTTVYDNDVTPIINITQWVTRLDSIK